MLKELLREGLETLGIPADETALERFRVYYEALTEANQVMNLTAVTGEAQTARLHFLDSAAPLLLYNMAGKRLIDVGTGAGFPGVPLKILCPGLRLTLLDSQRKRVAFLQRLCGALELDDTECIHGRAEDRSAGREAFDFSVSRAVARLRLLCELCLPYVKPGGVFLALKGPAAGEELAEADRAIRTLGGELERVADYPVPGTDLRHNLIVIQKVKPTPDRYPRPFAQMKKAPL